MRIASIGGLLICAAAASLAAPASAQDQGYRLLVENGVDAIAVRHVVADRLGEPAATGSISKQMLQNEDGLARVRAEAGGLQTIVVGCPELIRAVGGNQAGARRISTDLARVMPAETLQVARID
ncbi:hypothetical protein ACFB49_10080 [Sphingomonas sp. DBB INV C78]